MNAGKSYRKLPDKDNEDFAFRSSDQLLSDDKSSISDTKEPNDANEQGEVLHEEKISESCWNRNRVCNSILMIWRKIQQYQKRKNELETPLPKKKISALLSTLLSGRLKIHFRLHLVII